MHLEVYPDRPRSSNLKMDRFGHEGVILHSRHIRTTQGNFGFLTDPARRAPFSGQCPLRTLLEGLAGRNREEAP